MAVPFVDSLTTNLDHSLPLTIGEFDEFGNAKDNKKYLGLLCKFCNSKLNISYHSRKWILKDGSMQRNKYNYVYCNKNCKFKRKRIEMNQYIDEGYLKDKVSLVGRHVRSQEIEFIQEDASVYQEMKQYVGSVVGSHDRSLIATTGPRGGLVLIWDTVKLKLISKRSIPDVCGEAPFDHDFF